MHEIAADITVSYCCSGDATAILRNCLITLSAVSTVVRNREAFQRGRERERDPGELRISRIYRRFPSGSVRRVASLNCKKAEEQRKSAIK